MQHNPSMATEARGGVRVSPPPAPGRRLLASRLLAISTAAIVAATLMLTFVAVGDAYRRSNQAQDLSVLIAATIGIAAMAVVGAILAARAPASPIGLLFQVAALSMALAVGPSVYGARALLDLHGLPGVPYAGWLSQI